MAESLPLERSIDAGSENLPEQYCEPCYELKKEIKPVAGHCIDCYESLCFECFSYHLGPKPFRNHKLVDKSAKPRKQLKPENKSQNAGEICHLHPGSIIQSFCKSHSQLCCKVCHTINHTTCDVVEDISQLAQNIKDSQEFQTINEKLITLKKGFEKNLRKTGSLELIIQNNFTNAINDIKKLRDEIDKLLNETEKLAEKVKEEDFMKVEKVSSTCNLVIEQINNITSNFDTLKETRDDERLFILIKRTESQLHSLEESLDKLDNDNTVREYKFEPDEKLTDMMRQLSVLGHLTLPCQVYEQRISHTKVATIQEQMAKSPVHVKDINTKSASESNLETRGSLILPNNQFLITDYNNKKVKQFDSVQGNFITELTLTGSPRDITQVKADEVAVTVEAPNEIQFITVSKQSLQKGKDIPVNGTCHGIAYNDKDKTFVVTFTSPAKVEIIDMTGTVLKTLDNMFVQPFHVALSPDMKSMYVTEYGNHSVKLLTLGGNIKAEYKDSRLRYPSGIYVHKSGLVYVVGCDSNTFYQLEPKSGSFKLLLERKDGMDLPWSICYCDTEDKLFVGMLRSNIVKVFEMK